MSVMLLPTERGSFTPRTVLRRVRLFKAMPPAMPTAAAPTAAAGAAALPATDLTVSTTPLLLPLRLAVERVERLVVLPPARFDPFREALLVDRVERVPLFFAAVLAPVVFFAVEVFRLDDFDALLVRFALLFGALTGHLDLLPRPYKPSLLTYPNGAGRTHCAKTCTGVEVCRRPG